MTDSGQFVAWWTLALRLSKRQCALTLRRTPTTGNVLLAHAFQAAVKKARELRWIA